MVQKNLIYIFADQWNKRVMGLYNKEVYTPTMDSFTKNSLCLHNAISTYPLCSPHRASLLTGKYPYTLGMWTNCKPGLDEIIMLDPQETTIASVLKEQGYQTAYIGKWHLDASEMNYTNNPPSGAKEWDAYTPPGERRHGFDFWYSYGAMDNHMNPHYWQDSPKQIFPKKWSPEAETDVALEYLQQIDSKQPFCMFISWNPPHPPYDQLPQRLAKKYTHITPPKQTPPELYEDPLYQQTLCQYYSAVTGLDEQFKRILDYLQESGLDKDTYVVLSADHGDMLGAHGLMGKNVWYEESIGIPFIIRGPSIIPGDSDLLFSSIDHMPTLLDLLDVDIPDSVEGRSLARYFDGFVATNSSELASPKIDQSIQVDTEVLSPEPEALFLSMIPGSVNMVQSYHIYGLNHHCYGWRGVRTKTHTYIVNNGSVPGAKQCRWLYNLIKDPLQLHPVQVKPNTPIANIYDPILRGFLDEIGDPFLL